MHRLYLQVYLAFVLILIVFGVLTALAWEATEGGGREETVESVAQFLGEYMPGADRPASELASWLAGINARFPVDLAVFAPDLSLVAQAGRSLVPPDDTGIVDHWAHVSGGVRVTLSLPDGRWLVAFHPRNHSLRWLLVPAALAVAVAIGAFPLARRLTGRIERLKERVDDLGAGDLASRVQVEGHDEIASLASSFNGAASRIEKLVNAQRNLLASASHELRSPLTRVRMAVELLPNPSPDVRNRLVQDINELDELIEELLLGSRLEANVTAPVFEPVDILGLLAEEAARVDAELAGEPVIVLGDRTLLRRMLRNLLENARRHGRGTNVSARVQSTDSGTVISVEDEGPGVEANERERIFEPFYRPAGMREGKDKGVGLGLSLVRQIARHHHGDVKYVVEAGRAYFQVDLPEGPSHTKVRR